MDLCSPGCGPGTCGDECGARRNCVIFVGVTFGADFGILLGSDTIEWSLASIDGGEGGMVTMGATGGVGG
jgi:hypothetical protein